MAPQQKLRIWTLPVYVLAVLNAFLLVVGGILLVLWTVGFQAGNGFAWIAGVGASMIATALTSTVLGIYEILRVGSDAQRQKAALEDLLSGQLLDLREHVVNHFRATQALAESPAQLEVIRGPEELYARATRLSRAPLGPPATSSLLLT